MSATSILLAWAADLLGRLGLTPTANRLTNLLAWALTEGGWFNGDLFNPINTTQPEPGSHGTNAPGVQTFPTYEEGMTATLVTLHNGHYQAILDALGADAGPNDFAAAVTSSPWGTQAIAASTFTQAAADVAAYVLQSPQEAPAMPDRTAIVDVLLTPKSDGAWQLQGDGGVRTAGAAPFLGSYPGLPAVDQQPAGTVRTFTAITPHRFGQPGYTLWDDAGEPYDFA